MTQPCSTSSVVAFLVLHDRTRTLTFSEKKASKKLKWNKRKFSGDAKGAEVFLKLKTRPGLMATSAVTVPPTKIILGGQ